MSGSWLEEKTVLCDAWCGFTHQKLDLAQRILRAQVRGHGLGFVDWIEHSEPAELEAAEAKGERLLTVLSVAATQQHMRAEGQKLQLAWDAKL